jgi:transcriptional regulator with XRE-family HTH domain
MSDRQLTTYGEFADILVSLPTLVLNTRRQRRISQRDAAAQAGVSPSTLCRLETGVGDISLEGAIAVLHWMDRLPRAGGTEGGGGAP